tara:strand:- start:105 stop:554 length:450 start_codon:yes stop_codon:yes gene_type:complete
MAIARGTGTEILRTASFETVTDSTQDLIVGVQHHIYTVLSIVIFANTLNATNDYIRVWISGWDSKQGLDTQSMFIFQQVIPAKDTFVWNDKFSFSGYAPVDYTGPLNTATEQDANADQGGGQLQKLQCDAYNGNDDYDVHITFIDQNNE